MPDVPDPLVVRLQRENRAALLAREDKQLKRMAKDWIAIEQSLQDDMFRLAEDITRARAGGLTITEQLIREMARYKTLNAQLKREILKYAKDQAAKDIAAEQLVYAKHGLSGAAAAINAQFALGVVFNTLSVDAFEAMSGLLGNGSPLYKLLREAYPDALDGIVKAMLEGVAKGFGPNQIALNMAKRMGLGLDRLTLIARTEQLRMWRIATQQQYQESGVVLYHMRVCARDSRTCMACLAADGEKIPVTQVLDDHPRGRCTSVPVVRGAKKPVWQYGEEWFMKQSPTVQKEMMGPMTYDLWQRKQFSIQKLRGVSYSKIWGNSPRVRTLKEVLGTV